MSGETIRISAQGGRQFDGYIAVPEARSGPGIVLLDEHTADDDARQVADLFAEEGYIVLCPMAFEAEDDATAAVAALRERGECIGKIAALGFRRGGLTALRAAAEKRVDCAICYDPPEIDIVRELAPRLTCPVVLHFAGNDPAATPAAVARLRDVTLPSSGERPARYRHLSLPRRRARVRTQRERAFRSGGGGPRAFALDRTAAPGDRSAL